MALRNFIGVGWMFPIRFDSRTGGVKKDGTVSLDQQMQRVRQSLQHILGIRKGELFLQRGFGSTVRDLIFQLDTFNLGQRFEFAAIRAIEDEKFGEPRVVVNRVSVILNRRTGTAEADMDIQLRTSNSPGNLVFPFFVDETERGNSAQPAVGT
jgi:phage baseplate assembly protein W